MATAGDDAELIDVAPPVQHAGDGERGTKCEEEDVAEREADCGAPRPGFVPATKEAVEEGYGDREQGQRDGQDAGQFIGTDRNGRNRRQPNREHAPEPMPATGPGPGGDRSRENRARDQNKTDGVEVEIGKGVTHGPTRREREPG